MSYSASVSRSIEQIQMTAVEMGDLVDDVVFLGGCVAGFLVDEVARMAARATEDVDVIVDIANRVEYYQFGNRLKKKGFQEAADENIICRWYKQVHGGRLILDVMPVDPGILGFSNPWYPIAVQKNELQVLPNGTTIRVIKPLAFMATKFSAWDSRGMGDIYHRDIEDVVYVLENRSQIAKDYLDETDQKLRSYLKEQLTNLLNNPTFVDHLPGMVSSQESDLRVLNTMKLIIQF